MSLKGKWRTQDLTPEYTTVILLITPGIAEGRDGLITFTGDGPLSGPGVHISLSEGDPVIMDLYREELGSKPAVSGTFEVKSSDENSIAGTLIITQGESTFSRDVAFTSKQEEEIDLDAYDRRT